MTEGSLPVIRMEAHGARGRRRRHIPVALLDRADGSTSLDVLGGEGGIQTGEEVRRRAEADGLARRRDRHRCSDLSRHDEMFF